MGILDLDAGNTRVKWRYVSAAGGSERSGSLSHQEVLDGSLPNLKPRRVRLACVAGSAIREALVMGARANWGVQVEEAQVCDNWAGVRQGYRQPERLGVDRWLGLLAARALTAEAALVVSCGSAITADLMNPDGQHQGGYIIPGFESMRQSLFRGTQAVKVPELSRPDVLTPGRDTAEAVDRALVLGVKGLVENAAAFASRPPLLLLTGGDAHRVAPFLQSDESEISTRTQYRPNLVLDGLALALP